MFTTRTKKIRNKTAPLYGNRHNMLEKPVIQIGPERNDHLSKTYGIMFQKENIYMKKIINPIKILIIFIL